MSRINARDEGDRRLRSSISCFCVFLFWCTVLFSFYCFVQFCALLVCFKLCCLSDDRMLLAVITFPIWLRSTCVQRWCPAECCFPAECKYIPLLYQLYLSQCIPCVCLSLSTLFVTRCAAWAIAPNGLPETCWTWQPCWVQIYFSHYINFVSSTVFVSVHQIVLSHIINCICLSSSTVFVSVYQLHLSQLINCICLS